MKVLLARQIAWCKLVTFALVVSCIMMMATDASSSTSPPASTVARESTSSKVIEKETQYESSSKRQSNDVVARFYLIRHGQTLANLDGLVLGQTDSPLTAQGEQQARLLGRSDLITKQDFWRRYTSDLGRARQTANLVLGEEKSLEDHGVKLEPLLREVAKGVRELYPKVLNYKQATERFRKEHGPEEPFPLLESEDDVMARFYQWMFQVVRDVIQEYLIECQADSNERRSSSPRVYPVFAVSHSATLRAAIGRLVREELPATIDFSPVGRDGAQKGALQVPNTSVTIIDITPRNIHDELWDPERKSQAPANPSFLWGAKLKTLTYTKHYQDVS